MKIANPERVFKVYTQPPSPKRVHHPPFLSSVPPSRSTPTRSLISERAVAPFPLSHHPQGLFPHANVNVIVQEHIFGLVTLSRQSTPFFFPELVGGRGCVGNMTSVPSLSLSLPFAILRPSGVATVRCMGITRVLIA